MKYKKVALSLGVTFTSAAILLFSCQKINEATELGGDLIPPVDNITTFDTTLEVQAFNDTFSLATDSSYTVSSDEHFVGLINNDPIFGKTDAKLYLQLKPAYYKYTFANRPDSLFIDSAVLVLNYVDTYGDTTTPQTMNVYEIAQSSDFRVDSVYKLRESNIAKGPQLGTRTFAPFVLNDSIKAYQDTTTNQLRIRLNDAFGQRLLNYDTTGTTSPYSSDSAFNANFKGFVVESTSGNSVIGVDLSAANTKLAIYYRYHNKSVTDFDTTVAYFSFTSASASANFVKRDYSGTPVALAAGGGATPDNLVYLQNSPGSFANIKIPGLAALSNRVVHRAELIMEEVYDISDSTFPAPGVLYVDAFDPTLPGFRTIPYDLIYDAVSTSTNLTGNLGGLPYRLTDPGGNPVRIWRFNMSRYVQNIVNGKAPAYDLRVFAPFYSIDQYRPTPTAESSAILVKVNPTAVKGRVRLGGGNHPTQKMRLRIVYSKI